MARGVRTGDLSDHSDQCESEGDQLFNHTFIYFSPIFSRYVCIGVIRGFIFLFTFICVLYIDPV